ncbi:hypothetical protein [[Phormidium] sp. ETS-05]|uniref:hypothetical protein n=1 Tax=[Phormidium] sp. ETS-05 TaxID=222819 RepID=UPI0018EEED41|nr:hypothetical protein [[Phormidium] sp. ETS-05]
MTNWQFLQWFTWEDLEADGLIAKVEQKATKLRDIATNVKELRKILCLEALTEIGYISDAMRIIAADEHGRLTLHPYIVQQIKQHTREMWVNLLKTATIPWNSLMCQLDETIPLEKDDSGRITKMWCHAKSLPEGEYIVFCRPMRHWGDIQLWHNRHFPGQKYSNTEGVVVMPTELASTMGRDFEGDSLSLVSADLYPNIAARIRGWWKSPETVKFPKIPRSEPLQKIAINQMDTNTGIIASLMTRAIDLGPGCYLQEVEIPIGGADTAKKGYPKNLVMLDFLGQQLQIAVDAMKSAYPNNNKGINACSLAIRWYEYNLYGGKISDNGFPRPNQNGAEWWRGLKNKEVYLTRPCPVNTPSVTLMCRLTELVNSYWREITLVSSIPEAFKNALFGSVVVTQYQIELAEQVRDEYRLAMAQSERESVDDQGHVNERLLNVYRRNVVKYYRYKADNIVAKHIQNGLTRESWAAAFWRVAHRAKSGTANLPFLCFPDEIIMALKAAPIPRNEFGVIATQHYSGVPTAPNIWDGYAAPVLVARGDWNIYPNTMVAHMQVNGQWQPFGAVNPSSSSEVEDGLQFNALIYSDRYFPADGRTSAAVVFPVGTDPSVIERRLWRRKLMVTNAAQGAWGPLLGRPWTWQGRVISSNHNNWHWVAEIFNIRVLSGGQIEAENPHATKLRGFHYMGRLANNNHRAVWPGQVIQLKAFTVGTTNYTHKIALYSPGVPDEECYQELGIEF